MPRNHENDISLVLQTLTADDITQRFDPRRLSRFLGELFRWNPRLGLVSKQDTPRVVIQLIRQSVRLWDFVADHAGLDLLEHRCRVADIGTGGGFPGMIWALLEPRLEITLIERKTRKTAFLERVAALTESSGVDVKASDLRDAAGLGSLRGAFDVVVMIAVVQPGRSAEAIAGLLTTGGYFSTIRSAEEPDPPARIGGVLERRRAELTADGRFVIYQKTLP